jgi:drug/metabolite transporter (DMT)-like permease
MAPSQQERNRLVPVVLPGVFVLLWATGFIGAKLGLPSAEPFTFLTLRFAIAIVLLTPIIVLARRPPIGGWRQVGHVAVVGVLVHAIYLGGVFAAIARGMPAGLSALIVSLQPLLTATLVGAMLGERVTRAQTLGLVLGLVGVTLVLSDKMAPSGLLPDFEGFDYWAVVLCLMALAGITFGVVYQKRHCGDVDLWRGAQIQYAAAALVSGTVALIFETNRIDWTGEFVFALTWLVLVLSIGAVSLLMVLIRFGEAARIASFFYLVPPVTALIAYFLFDEQLSNLALVGMAITAAGVALVVRRSGNGG